MTELYPEISPFKEEHLKVSELHSIYVEQVGNPNGYPIVFLHGGPGGGVSPDYRRYFDPSFYRIILFDQRGAGKSTPSAELRENTTWDLVSDIEKIRAHLKIEKWHVFGGSWGSTLALAYAETHPSRVSGLLLRGIFLCRRSELEWFYQNGASHVFPDYWEPYRDAIPVEERNDFMSAYYRRLTSPDLQTRIRFAQIWSKWEAKTAKLFTPEDAGEEFDDPKFALEFARIECHYFNNKAFFESDNYLLENASRIQNIPTLIVQGRYDMVCPARSAWDLHKALPQSKLVIVPDAGHSLSEPGIRSALIAGTNDFKKFTAL